VIRVTRSAEPPTLPPVRLRELAKLRALPKITKDDISGYRVIADDVWKMQHYKCCYCERKLTRSYEDVEHFRPKARADRAPGCAHVHGYWWLAFTWDNLLFSCALCNRTHKNDQFPLKIGSQALQPEEDAPGKEEPWLLDPVAHNGVEHIVFMPWSQRTVLPRDHGPRLDPTLIDRWMAVARNGSLAGDWSIRVCGLNHAENHELYLSHVRDEVLPHVKQVRDAVARSDRKQVKRCAELAKEVLLKKSVPYVGLSYDALRYLVPDAEIARFRVRWPQPAQIGA
jgi:5-methylcytosine-specific restriction endonuclease McrA